jgi:hypothetical protein
MNALTVLESPLLQQIAKVQHGFFTRKGGASTGLLTSLNFNSTKGDAPENLEKNKETALGYFGKPLSSLVLVHQVHGKRILLVDSPFDPYSLPDADGLITRTKGLVIGVLTADCVPVLLADPTKEIIGAVHAGWKGTLQGIVQEAIQQMVKAGSNAGDIHASIGPSIAQESYEVGPEVYEAFTSENNERKSFFKPSTDLGHFYFDLKGLVTDNLKKAGVQYIHDLKRDTYKEKDLFFSCRRATHLGEKGYGGSLSAIMLR